MLLGNYNGMPSDPITPLRGIRQALPEARVLYAAESDLADDFPVLDVVPAKALSRARRHARADGRVLQSHAIAGSPLFSDKDPTVTRLEGRRAARRHESGRLRRAMDGHAARAGDRPYRLGLVGTMKFRSTSTTA